MKNKFSIFIMTLNILAIAYIIYDFIASGILRNTMLMLEPITHSHEILGGLLWIGVLYFLIFHILSFIFIADQFRIFKKATVLRVIGLILGISSCVMLLNDIACLSDIFKEYAEGLEVEFEWSYLYASNALHGIFFLFMLATTIEGLIHQKKC